MFQLVNVLMACMNQEKNAFIVLLNATIVLPNTNVKIVLETEKMHQYVTAQMVTMTMELKSALNVLKIVPLVLEVHLDVSHVLEITLMHQIVSHHHQKLLLLQLLTSQSDQLKLSHVIITVTLVNNFQAIV